jgi:hypothetical protein
MVSNDQLTCAFPRRGDARATEGGEMTTTTAHRNTAPAWEACDRCGAASAARITLATGGQLHLCGHHLRDHHGRLRELSAEIRLSPDREHLSIPGDR